MTSLSEYYNQQASPIWKAFSDYKIKRIDEGARIAGEMCRNAEKRIKVRQITLAIQKLIECSK